MARSTYQAGIDLMADDLLLTATTWSDLASAVEEFAEGWGMSADTVGDDVLAAVSARFASAVGR